MGKFLDAGKILPVIARVFPFDQTKEAPVYLKEGRAKGKVVVKVTVALRYKW
jgi:NADPH:quinone reductase-like Zn-dependent oxidoreductase